MNEPTMKHEGRELNDTLIGISVVSRRQARKLKQDEHLISETQSVTMLLYSLLSSLLQTEPGTEEHRKSGSCLLNLIY